MNDHNQQTAIEPYMAIERRKKFNLLPQRREDYPIIPTPNGDHIVLPIKDYRKFRGETSYWQFMVLVLFVGCGLIVYAALTQPPVTVEKPFVVEKQVQVPVPTRCVIFCGK